MISLIEILRRVGILNAFKNVLTYLKEPLFKLVPVTTDGTGSMIGRMIGFITISPNDIEFPYSLS